MWGGSESKQTADLVKKSLPPEKDWLTGDKTGGDYQKEKRSLGPSSYGSGWERATFDTIRPLNLKGRCNVFSQKNN